MPHTDWTIDGLGPGIEGFLNPLLDLAGLDLGYDIYEVSSDDEAIGPDMAVDFHGADAFLLRERRGALLLALEHLALEALGVPHQDRYRLIFDVDDYRMLRIEELCQSARAAAERVKRTGQRFAFRPMNSRERRIVHLALRHDEGVTSLSEGIHPHRYTVVSLREEGTPGRA